MNFRYYSDIIHSKSFKVEMFDQSFFASECSTQMVRIRSWSFAWTKPLEPAGKSGATSKRSGWIWMVPYLEVTFTTPRIAPRSSWASHCNNSCQHMKGHQKVTQPTAGNLYAHSFTVNQWAKPGLCFQSIVQYDGTSSNTASSAYIYFHTLTERERYMHTLRCVTVLHYTTLHYTAFHKLYTLNDIPFHSIALRYITLHTYLASSKIAPVVSPRWPPSFNSTTVASWATAVYLNCATSGCLLVVPDWSSFYQFHCYSSDS